jgi:DNA-binding FadR family transcriptional regulator
VQRSDLIRKGQFSHGKGLPGEDELTKVFQHTGILESLSKRDSFHAMRRMYEHVARGTLRGAAARFATGVAASPEAS